MNCYWVSYNPTNPVRLRWDESFVEDIITQRLKCVGDELLIRHEEDTRNFAADMRNGNVTECVVVYPAGGCEPKHAEQLKAELDRRHIEHVILFIVSDEASTFPVDIIRPIGSKIDLWVMTPQPEIDYSGFNSVTFIGDGDAQASRMSKPGHTDKDLDVVFMGQITHPRREAAFAAAKECSGNNLVEGTDGFTKGRPRLEYLSIMDRAKVVPCPSGLVSQDSFRAYEALTYGAVPVVDDIRQGDGGGSGYWEMLDPEIGGYLPIIEDWQNLPAVSAAVLDNWPLTPVMAHGWWHRHRRDLAEQFASQAKGPGKLSFVIPTSVVPDHPDTSMLETTVRSIRERHGGEILILCDGVRAEQSDAGQRYLEYVRRVMLLAETWYNVTPIFFETFHHQSGMMKRFLERYVMTEYVMFVEHDTPLVGDIPLAQILDDMGTGAMNLVRFYHERALHPDHESMFLDTSPKPKWPYLRTMQWSQRPHIAATDFYVRLMDEYFSSEARTMIEDVLYAAQEFAWRKHGMEEGWRQWRTALYAPEGDIMRSGHLDGRGDDPKYPMLFDYPASTDLAGLPAPGYR